jgi:hypothetical protein
VNKEITIPILSCLVLTGLAIFVAFTLSSVVLFLPGVIVTFFVYLGTFYRKMPGPRRILPIYLLLLGLQFLHFTEEYLTDFVTAVPALLGQEPYPVDYWITFNMVAYFLFALGGIAIFRDWKEHMIVPLFFIVVGVLFNAAGHILLTLYTGGYFPGLFTAILYAYLGPVILRRIRSETK